MPVSREYMRCNPQQPCNEWRTPPLEPAYPRQGLMEDLGCQVLRFFASRHPPHDEGIDPVKVLLIGFSEAGWVTLRRLHQKPLIRVVFNDFQVHLRSTRLSCTVNGGNAAEGYGCGHFL